MSASQLDGSWLPPWITYDTTSGQFQIAPGPNDLASLVVRVKANLLNVIETQDLSIEALGWHEYYNTDFPDPYTLLDYVDTNQPVPYQETIVQTQLVTSDFSLTEVTYNFHRLFLFQLTGIRLTFTENTGTKTTQIQEYGSFDAHNQAIYDRVVNALGPQSESFAEQVSFKITKKVKELAFCITTSGVKVVKWIRFNYYDNTHSPDIIENDCPTPLAYILDDGNFAGLTMSFNKYNTFKFNEVGVWRTNVGSMCSGTPSSLSFTTLSEFTHAIAFSTVYVQQFETSLPSACVTYSLVIKDSSGNQISTPTWVNFDLIRNEFSINPPLGTASGSFQAIITAQSQVVAGLSSTSQSKFQIVATCSLTSLTANLGNDFYYICQRKQFNLTQNMTQTPNCHLFLQNYSIQEVATNFSVDFTQTPGNLIDNQPKLVFQTCNQTRIGQIQQWQFSIQAGGQTYNGQFTLTQKHDCEGTQIKGSINSWTGKHAQFVPSMIATADLNQNSRLINTIAEAHANKLYCGPFNFAVVSGQQPLSGVDIYHDGTFSINFQGINYRKAQLKVQVSLTNYPNQPNLFTTMWQINQVCHISTVTLTSQTNEFSYIIGSPAVTYSLDVGQTAPCTYQTLENAFFWQEKPDQTFVTVQSQSSFRIYTTQESDEGTYNFIYGILLDNQWQQYYSGFDPLFPMKIKIVKCPVLKPIYTSETIFETNYEIRGSTQTLIMPQYNWNSIKDCPIDLQFKLINLTDGWLENQVPDFMKPDFAKGRIVLDGKQLKESNKIFKFRLFASSIQSTMTSQDYEFQVRTTLFNTAPVFISPIPNQIVIIGQDVSWELPQIKDKEGDQTTQIQVKLGSNSDWLYFDSKNMSFKVDGQKSKQLKTGTVDVKIILQDQYGAEATYSQSIFLDLQVIQDQTDLGMAQLNQTLNTTLPNDIAICSNQTSNISCSKNTTKDEANQFARAINDTQMIDGFLVVGMGQPNYENKNQAIADYYAQQIENRLKSKSIKEIKPPQPKKLEISLNQKEFGCGVNILFSEPIDFSQPDFMTKVQDLFTITVVEQTPKRSIRELKVKFKAGKMSVINKMSASKTIFSFNEYREYKLDLSIDDDGRQISYHVNFSDPYEISMGEIIHYLQVQPGDLSLLRGKNSPLILPVVQPTQFQLASQIRPNEVNSIKAVTMITQQAAKTSIIVTFILSFLLGTSLSTVWSLVGNLQNIALMAFVSINYPGNANTFIQRIFWISSMDVFPEEIIDRWSEIWIKFSSRPLEDELISQRFSQRFQQMGLKNTNPLFNLQQSGILIIILAACICITFIAPILLGRCANPKISKVAAFFEKQKQNLLWNTTLRLFIEIYLDICIAGLIRSNFNEWDSKYEQALTIIGWFMIAFATCFPVLTFTIIWRNRNQIESEQFETTYGELTDGINITVYNARYYWCFFMVQRLIQSIIIVQFQRYQVIQIQALFFLLTAQMIYVGWLMPFVSKLMNQLEIFNIYVTLFSCYFLISFTDFLWSNKVRYDLAWILISVIALAIAVNIFFFIKENKDALLQQLKIKYLKFKTYFRLKKQLNQKEKNSSVDQASEQESIQSGTERMDENQVELLSPPPIRIQNPASLQKSIQSTQIAIGFQSGITMNSSSIHEPQLSQIKKDQILASISPILIDQSDYDDEVDLSQQNESKQLKSQLGIPIHMTDQIDDDERLRAKISQRSKAIADAIKSPEKTHGNNLFIEEEGLIVVDIVDEEMKIDDNYQDAIQNDISNLIVIQSLQELDFNNRQDAKKD